MPEALAFITLGSPDTPKQTSEPHITVYEFVSEASTFPSENGDGCRVFLAVRGRQPQPAPVS